MRELIEKIIEKLEEKANQNWLVLAERNGYKRSIEIVKQAAEDFATDINVWNNSWIPCSERLPEEHDSMFARFKGTDKWRDSMFEKTSNEVTVTIADEKGEKATTHAHTTDGTWKCDILRACPIYRVIAWQPLPAPYRPKGE